MKTIAVLLLAADAFTQPRQFRIAAIDFFGYSGLEPVRLRAELRSGLRSLSWRGAGRRWASFTHPVSG